MYVGLKIFLSVCMCVHHAVCVCAILCVIYVCVSVYYQECIGQNNNITRSAVGTGIEYKHRI